MVLVSILLVGFIFSWYSSIFYRYSSVFYRYWSLFYW